MTNHTATTDQSTARDREFDRLAQKVAAYFLALFALVTLYAVLALTGLAPALPWTVIAK